jgi:ferric-dicitrate binding protein FerR (iron transport regulator)
VKNTKTCCHCRERKSLADFPRNRRMIDGLSSWCSVCHAEATRRWREQNPQHVEAYNARRRAEYAAKREAEHQAARKALNKALREQVRRNRERDERHRERFRKAVA